MSWRTAPDRMGADRFEWPVNSPSRDPLQPLANDGYEEAKEFEALSVTKTKGAL